MKKNQNSKLKTQNKFKNQNSNFEFWTLDFFRIWGFKFWISPKRGFTLVETILAISIIGMIIVTVAQLTQSSIAMGRSAMNQFVAFHQAEEGLEIIRNRRDSNWLQNKAWRSGLADGTYENTSRVIEITTEGKAMRVKSRVKYQDRGKEKVIELVAEFTDWKKGPI